MFTPKDAFSVFDSDDIIRMWTKALDVPIQLVFATGADKEIDGI